MDLFRIAVLVLAALVVLGASAQTFFPESISKKTSDALTSLTIAVVGIALSTWAMMWFLKLKNREGFEDESMVTRWRTFAKDERLEEICSLYADIYAKMLAVEKGTPPDEVLTDAKAREKTDALFAAQMTGEVLPCAKVAAALEASTEAELIPLLTELPDTVGVQGYQTALACRSLLIQAYMKYMYAKMKAEMEKEKEEGFEDVPFCTKEQEQQRKVPEAAQQCRSVEEIPKEQLTATLVDKLDRMQKASAFSQRKDPLSKVLEDCAYYKGQMEKEKKEAEDKSNSYKFR